jgi:hypothetical protein
MKPDLTLIDSLRRLIDFAGLSGDPACQAVLATLLEDVAKAIVQEKFVLPANLAEAPSSRLVSDCQTKAPDRGSLNDISLCPVSSAMRP